jgi:hypothetical protein
MRRRLRGGRLWHNVSPATLDLQTSTVIDLEPTTLIQTSTVIDLEPITLVQTLTVIDLEPTTITQSISEETLIILSTIIDNESKTITKLVTQPPSTQTTTYIVPGSTLTSTIFGPSTTRTVTYNVPPATMTTTIVKPAGTLTVTSILPGSVSVSFITDILQGSIVTYTPPAQTITFPPTIQTSFVTKTVPATCPGAPCSISAEGYAVTWNSDYTLTLTATETIYTYTTAGDGVNSGDVSSISIQSADAATIFTPGSPYVNGSTTAVEFGVTL